MLKRENVHILSPPPSPSSSILSTQAAKQYSHRERDMVVRNSELSFHVRRLEERVGSLEKIRKDLVRLQFAGPAPWPPLHPLLLFPPPPLFLSARETGNSRVPATAS